jgi:hypothetical protein
MTHNVPIAKQYCTLLLARLGFATIYLCFSDGYTKAVSGYGMPTSPSGVRRGKLLIVLKLVKP